MITDANTNVTYLKRHRIYSPAVDHEEICQRVDCTINRFTLDRLLEKQKRSASSAMAAWCLIIASGLTIWAVIIHLVWP